VLEEIRGLAREQLEPYAIKHNLTVPDLLSFINNPGAKCGSFVEQKLLADGSRQAVQWSVGFVSVAAGILLASRFLQEHILARTASSPVLSPALRYYSAMHTFRESRPQRRAACRCISEGTTAYNALWGGTRPGRERLVESLSDDYP
jgi:hypothetical protein